MSSKGRYEKIKLLGTGSFGEAWLVRSSQSRRQYVIKEMKLTQNVTKQDKERVNNEVDIIKSCCHINIIKYKDYFMGLNENKIPTMSIVMEYADAGDLCQRIEHQRDVEKAYFTEIQIRNWFVQICFALQYLHKKNILHRDLKTQNIFISSSKLLKLGDFGISKTLSSENDFATTGIGTPQYLSPEICRQQPYDYKSDIWGLGCVLYEMCALKPAFPFNDFALLIQSILNGVFKPLPPCFNVSLGELVKVMLRSEPSRRPTVQQLLSATVLQADIHAYMEYIKTMSLESSSTTGSGSGGSQLDLRKDSASSLSSHDGR